MLLIFIKLCAVAAIGFGICALVIESAYALTHEGLGW